MLSPRQFMGLKQLPRSWGLRLAGNWTKVSAATGGWEKLTKVSAATGGWENCPGSVARIKTKPRVDQSILTPREFTEQ